MKTTLRTCISSIACALALSAFGQDPTPSPTALASVAQGGVSLANSADGSTQPARAVKRGRGRQIAIGAALGIAAGAAYASSNKSATPTGTKMVMFAIPAGLLGAAVGAFIP